MTNCATAPGSPRSHPPSPLHGGWGLLKLYAASLACFVLVGSIVFILYLILSSNAGDTWSTEEQMLLPLPPPIVLLLAAVVMYVPIIWAAALPLAAIATSLYCALALTFSPRILRAGVGALWGALAAVATAVAFQSPEVFHTGAAWAPSLGIGAAIAGAVSGALAAIIARPWRSAPKSGSAVVDPTRGGHSRVTVVLAWGVALAAIAVAFINGRARTDEVLLRRDRAVAADALRALPVAERASGCSRNARIGQPSIVHRRLRSRPRSSATTSAYQSCRHRTRTRAVARALGPHALDTDAYFDRGRWAPVAAL